MLTKYPVSLCLAQGVSPSDASGDAVDGDSSPRAALAPVAQVGGSPGKAVNEGPGDADCGSLVERGTPAVSALESEEDDATRAPGVTGAQEAASSRNAEHLSTMSAALKANTPGDWK